MSNSFHLAIPAGDLEKAEAFYTGILGCKTGNREKGKWVDIEFGKLKVPTLPSFHPAFLLRQPAQKKYSWEDLKMLKKKIDES